MSNHDKPAFPAKRYYLSEDRYLPMQGLTKRELLAAMAMQGLLSDPDTRMILENAPKEDCPQHVARAAVIYADALLAALEEGDE